MDQLIELIQNNVAYAPYIIFVALLLAGFNLPISEDVMLFITALLAADSPDMLVPLFCSVFFGAYFSDLICYTLGRTLGPRIWKFKFFASMAPAERVDQLSHYLKKYGAITLFLGRFIPFGVRNALFLTAGLGKMDARKFAFFDFLACSISCTAQFSLYYHFGQDVVEYVKKGNIVFFSLACAVVLGILIRMKVKKSAKTREATPEQN
ncbi:MAG: DedA family protein [Oligoflexales bacterium]|nr:DedA family protein [Oligoflexales bacterium]